LFDSEMQLTSESRQHTTRVNLTTRRFSHLIKNISTNTYTSSQAF
jgi:hypothetical protein